MSITQYKLIKDYSKSYIPAGFGGLAGMLIGGGLLAASFFVAAPVAAFTLLISGSILFGLSTITAGAAAISKVLQWKRNPEIYFYIENERVPQQLYSQDILIPEGFYSQKDKDIIKNAQKSLGGIQKKDVPKCCAKNHDDLMRNQSSLLYHVRETNSQEASRG